MKQFLPTLFATSALLLSVACQGPKEAHASDVRPYTLKDCIVTDNALGSMGDPVTIVHEGQEVKFCCAPCEEEFLADPDKFLAKLPR